jgi:hypothetical protein
VRKLRQGVSVRRAHKIAVIAGLFVGLLMAVGCSAGTSHAGTNEKRATQAPAMTAQEILTKAASATPVSTSGKITFDLTLDIDFDMTNLPEDMPAGTVSFLEEPIRLSGFMTASAQPAASHVSAKASISGQSISLDAKILDNKIYVGYRGKWYEGPAEAEDALTDSAYMNEYQEGMNALMSQLSPASWLKDAQVVGTESVGGTEAYHVKGAVDVAALMTDITSIMESEEFQDLQSGMPGATEDDMYYDEYGYDEPVLSEAEIEEIVSCFKKLDVDLWIAADGFTVVKSKIALLVEPPAGEDNEGVKAVSMSGGFTMTDIGKPVEITAPSSRASFDALGMALMADPLVQRIMSGTDTTPATGSGSF